MTNATGVKTCLITGATSGIGWNTAKEIASLGMCVILHGRNPKKLHHRSTWLKSEFPNAVVETIQADFEDLHQVFKMVQDLEGKGVKLDILVNNAGAFFNRRQITAQGVEKTFQINHLASFLLTNELLKRTRISDSARIIIVTSNAYRMGILNFEDLAMEQGYFGMRAYARSKLANLLFSAELAQRLHSSGITVNAVHPGHIASDIWKTNFGVIGPVLKGIMSLFAGTAAEGAESLTYLAVSPEVKGVTGGYFDRCEIMPAVTEDLDRSAALRLWQVSEGLVRQFVENKVGNLADPLIGQGRS